MTRYGIIDIRAKINNKNEVDVEMQVADQSNILERILFSFSLVSFSEKSIFIKKSLIWLPYI